MPFFSEFAPQRLKAQTVGHCTQITLIHIPELLPQGRPISLSSENGMDLLLAGIINE
jgi:hypothetical protein